MRKKILLADNDASFIDTRAEFIHADFEVLKAYTFDDARRLFANTYFHLAILDIRMVNDDDERDVSGLTLAKDPAYRSFPKIILTGFPSIPAVKDALGPMLDGLPPAVDFVSKLDGPEAMLQAIDKAFAEFVKINWNLGILSDVRNPLSFPHLVNLLSPNLPTDMLVYWVTELEDVFRRVFYSYQQVRLGRLFWHDHSRFCLSVLTQSLDGVTDLRVLVCGDRELMALERTQKEKLAPQIPRNTEFRGHAETTHFGANLYALSGADIEMLQTLRDLLQMGKERFIKTAFADLLGDVLKKWHQHGHTVLEKQDLMSVYRHCAGLADDEAAQSQLEQRFDALIQSVRTMGMLEIKRENQHIIASFRRQSSHRFPDPLTLIYTSLHHHTAPIICRISPGKLNTENILVDSEQRVWLTDYADARQMPQWWDFISLEAAIRFENSQMPDLIACQEFEMCLVKPNLLDEHLDLNETIPALRTNIALIEQIRQQAASETGLDIVPYYAGLLVWVMEAITHYDPGFITTQMDRLHGAHLLLAASMLAERLVQNDHAVINTHPVTINKQLRLGDDDKLWIGERYITTFSGLRLKLLRYLYQHAGQTVSVRSIIEKAYDETYHPADSELQNQRIRQEITRLREIIEPKQGPPCYIRTIREKGYCLETSGEPEN